MHSERRLDVEAQSSHSEVVEVLSVFMLVVEWKLLRMILWRV